MGPRNWIFKCCCGMVVSSLSEEEQEGQCESEKRAVSLSHGTEVQVTI